MLSCCAAPSVLQGDGEGTVTYKLSYFPITALGEPIRATFALGGIPFVDDRVPGEEWGKRKADPASAFFGKQMPALELNEGSSKKYLFQSRAILRYIGTIARYEGKPLYPKDLLEAYFCDEVIEMVEDIRGPLPATFAIKDQAEKEAARAALIKPEGKMFGPLTKLNERLGQFKFAAGDAPTIADLYAVTVIYMFQAPSFIDGFPAGSLQPFPNIVALKDRVMALPPLAKYYKDAEGIRAPFKVA